MHKSSIKKESAKICIFRSVYLKFTSKSGFFVGDKEMVKIRLTRMGNKKRAFYRIIVIESRAKRSGRPLDQVGYYNPMQNPAVVKS